MHRRNKHSKQFNSQLTDLFRLSITFSQCWSCDETREVWNLVVYIKKTACKHENVQLWKKILSLVSTHNVYWENKFDKRELFFRISPSLTSYFASGVRCKKKAQSGLQSSLILQYVKDKHLATPGEKGRHFKLTECLQRIREL